MEQTFNDFCRERESTKRGLFGFILWVFVETSAGIIRENITFIIMRNKNIIIIALATALILLVSLVAMQFTDEVVWDLFDFTFAGTLLFGTGLMYELVARKEDSVAYRVAVGVAAAAAFLLVWVNGAVGIIGEDNPANLLYGGVLAVGFTGAAIARLEPRGMARVLIAMAFVQMLVPVIALIVWRSDFAPGVAKVFALNAFFAVLFVGSALLFRRASATGPK